MMRTILVVVFFVGLVVGSVVRGVYTRPYRGSAVADDRKTGVDAVLAALPGLGMFVLPLIYALSSWLDGLDYPLPPGIGLAAGLVGAALFAGAQWLLYRSHADLGRNWTPTMQILEGQTLVTGGVYRRIRHPMYAAHLVWGLGQVLLLQNAVAGPATLLLAWPLLLYRVPREERMMTDRFGDAYRDYVRRTGRYLPRMGR